MMAAPWRLLAIVALGCLAIPPALGEVTGTRTLELTAFTVPAKDIDVASATGGVIGKLPFEEGDKVTAGDPLVSLKSETEAAELAVAQARVTAAEAEIKGAVATEELAKKEYERGKDLKESGGFISEGELDELRLRAEVALLNIQVARDKKSISALTADVYQARLDQMTVLAPFDGEIVRIYKHEGEAIEQHAALMRLVNVDTLHVRFVIPLADIENIKPGMKATFSFAPTQGAPKRTIPCTVFLVDVVAETGSDMFWGKARIDNAQLRHPPGVIGTFLIDIPDYPQDAP